MKQNHEMCKLKSLMCGYYSTRRNHMTYVLFTNSPSYIDSYNNSTIVHNFICTFYNRIAIALIAI